MSCRAAGETRTLPASIDTRLWPRRSTKPPSSTAHTCKCSCSWCRTRVPAGTRTLSTRKSATVRTGQGQAQSIRLPAPGLTKKGEPARLPGVTLCPFLFAGTGVGQAGAGVPRILSKT
jgi:hypothetical protein